VLVELKNQRLSLERRTGLLVGALEKVGIIPGIVALIAIYIRPELNKFPAVWVQSIAFGILAMYFMGAAAHVFMVRLDRYIMLLEMVIEAKKSAKLVQSLTDGQQLLPLGQYRNLIL